MQVLNTRTLQDGYIEEGYCPREPCARLPSTYINHYCANGGVVCPQFGGKAAEADKRALEVLQEAYGPDYKVLTRLPPPVGPSIHINFLDCPEIGLPCTESPEQQMETVSKASILCLSTRP